tara:strand:+ start:330 stop:560 length:231 start_codon:yes stop_codon:yes gene_type:complete
MLDADDPSRSGYGIEYEVCGLVCPKCHRVSGSGNFKTGEVTGWMTQREIRQSEAEYQRQAFSAEMNEWYGRGNHPF